MPQFQSPFEEKLYNERRDKLAQIRSIGERLGLSPAESVYPNSFAFTHTIPRLRQIGDPLSAEALEAALTEAAIAGRVTAIRVQGKAGFATLQQGGQRLQIYVRKDVVGDDLFALYKLLDLGDHIGVRGTLMRTRTGELTLKVHPVDLPGIDTPQPGEPKPNTNPLQFLAKAMLALPDKFHGLTDIELRYRQRYLDLFTDTGDAPNSEPTTNLSSRPESSRSEDAVERPAVPPPDAIPTRLPARAVFEKRAAILRAIRNFFDTRGYLEVETPMLHTIAGGAAARPFKTHHNALDIPLSLRIAPELYLKRLVVGGLDRVYEINRNFRNEGVSTQHNPEFTMLEFYQAYANYHDLMDLTQELITTVANEVNGTTTTHFNGHEIDLSKWTKLSMREAIVKFWPKELTNVILDADISTPRQLQILLFVARDYWNSQSDLARSNADALLEKIKTRHCLAELSDYTMHQVPADDSDRSEWAVLDQQARFHHRAADNVEKILHSSGGKLYSDAFEFLSEFPLLTREIFHQTVREHLIQPTIIYDFPLAVSPLSKVKPDEPDWVERFEFYIGGFEVGNAFSELNDPDDQHRRFEAQLAERDRGDDEAHAMDEDYVRALGYGLPPTAGEGIGIDRLTMILTGSRSIRDVILFPLMRPPQQSVRSLGDETIAPRNSPEQN